MRPEIIALLGVLASSTISGLIAFLVVVFKSKTDRANFNKQLNIQNEKNRYELLKERSERKIDIAYKFAELNQKNPETAQTFLNEVAKETAIGFLYLNDNDSKSKVWIRNDSNILIGRGLHCDICLSDIVVSREHCVIHVEDNKAYLVPLKPTNPIIINGRGVDTKMELKDGSVINIGSYEFIYCML